MWYLFVPGKCLAGAGEGGRELVGTGLVIQAGVTHLMIGWLFRNVTFVLKALPFYDLFL